MPKKYYAKNRHVKLDSEMFDFLSRLDETLREKYMRKALQAGTEVLRHHFKKRVPRSKYKKTSGYLQDKTGIKVDQEDKWGRKWSGRLTAPHIHLFEAGFEHTGPEPLKLPTIRGRVPGRQLIPKIKKAKRRNIKAAMWRELKKAAEAAGRKSGPK